MIKYIRTIKDMFIYTLSSILLSFALPILVLSTVLLMEDVY